VGKPEKPKGRAGLLYGLGAHAMWGLMPLYIWSMERVPPIEILAHRIIWCCLFLLFLVVVFRRWGDLSRVIRSGRTLGLLGLSSLLIAANWFCYIYAANGNETIQASLGYFINPLFSVLLGMIVFRERLRPVQWLAVALAAAGVLVLIVVRGQLPWIALALAVTFGFYGLVRKLTPVDAVVGLTVETLFLVPAAAACLFMWTAAGSGSFGQNGWAVDGLLLGTGIVTALPLLCFGQAARRLPLTTLGILQYVAPTLQFLLAVLVRGETFDPSRAVCFGLIWTALAVFSVESLVTARRRALVAAVAR
jgi:chloramphenicol-sensitive protein RarD